MKKEEKDHIPVEVYEDGFCVNTNDMIMYKEYRFDYDGCGFVVKKTDDGDLQVFSE